MVVGTGDHVYLLYRDAREIAGTSARSGVGPLGEARRLPFRYRLDAARFTADFSPHSDEQVALDAAR
jgi:hypothetical protein